MMSNILLTEGNVPALCLYRSVGFVDWRTQPQAIRTDSGLKGKVHMSLALAQCWGEAISKTGR